MNIGFEFHIFRLEDGRAIAHGLTAPFEIADTERMERELENVQKALRQLAGYIAENPPELKPRKPTGWQPIETAPKGEAVIVYGPRVGVVCEAIQDRRGVWRMDTCCGLRLDHYRNDGVKLTHWMPVPEPPGG